MWTQGIKAEVDLTKIVISPFEIDENFVKGVIKSMHKNGIDITKESLEEDLSFSLFAFWNSDETKHDAKMIYCWIKKLLFGCDFDVEMAALEFRYL